ncbi:hypothetical protein C8Q78DRAFT_1075409 [Trametes maxima]|nr:hypothetical protein C8Q78DRAFT_1075409 [Trametes maxima]
MSSDWDAMSHFTPLDELIQVIYQGSARFVIISSVDDTSWNVHIGLTGGDGRWWRGSWTEKDVRDAVGAKVSGFLLDSFVEKLADTFVKGEISIGDWSSAAGAPIKLVFGSQAKTPISVPLQELPPREAAAYATKVFVEIALQAQSRKCSLHPTSYDVPVALQTPAASSSSSRTHNHRSPESVDTHHHSPNRTKGKAKAPEANPESHNRSKRKADTAEDEIQALKAELEKTKRQNHAIMTTPAKLLSVNKPKAATSRAKGMSLANPTKKARKYKPIEFASDEDE